MITAMQPTAVTFNLTELTQTRPLFVLVLLAVAICISLLADISLH